MVISVSWTGHVLDQVQRRRIFWPHNAFLYLSFSLLFSDDLSSTKKQLEVVSKASSVEDEDVENQKLMKDLEEDYSRRLKEQEETQGMHVKRLVKEYETEKHEMEEKHAVY